MLTIIGDPSALLEALTLAGRGSSVSAIAALIAVQAVPHTAQQIA
jgi:hypothetical protein